MTTSQGRPAPDLFVELVPLELVPFVLMRILSPLVPAQAGTQGQTFRVGNTGSPLARGRADIDPTRSNAHLGRAFALASAVFALLLIPDSAAAAGLDGASLRWPWALPFVGLLLSIATGPLLFPRVWHNHYAKLAFVWSVLTVVPLAAIYGAPAAFAAFVHVMLGEYISFIAVLFALYVVAGGILVTGNLRGTPLVNGTILTFGTLGASVVGTTGAAMILIRPLIRANSSRLHNVHVFVFFIFLVANIGGALSPLGNPPLLVGFLHGVDFFWTTRNLLVETAVVAGLVLAIFLLLDLWHYRKDRLVTTVGEVHAPMDLKISGSVNFLLIAGIVGAILISAMWKPGVRFDVYGTVLELQNLVRDGVLVLLAILSLVLTPNEHREANDYSWDPIREVAILFAAIFICIIPVLAMLHAGNDGAFAWPLAFTANDGIPREVAYFWLTGLFSAFLDNAPAYLAFFELAGNDAQQMMGPLAPTLKAISMGAVFMGALTYIGNAPNFMVYAIASGRGIRMPSFFGYMLWSIAVLVPVFVLLTYVELPKLF
jgi:Na+/H+ antiporter NhaD/arsenite permease-like protein